jgi:hypothetical protein
MYGGGVRCEKKYPPTYLVSRCRMSAYGILYVGDGGSLVSWGE